MPIAAYTYVYEVAADHPRRVPAVSLGSTLFRAVMDLHQERATPLAILFWVGLAVATFVLLVIGYGTGFWS